MRHLLFIAITVILFLNFAGCTESKAPAVNEPAPTNESTVAIEPTGAPTHTPLPPNVRKDADGNLIKPDGWPIQEIIPKQTLQKIETGKTSKGRSVIYNLLMITPQNKPVAAAIPRHESPLLEWRITEVAELSGRDGKIFCYEYGAIPFPRNSNTNGVAEKTYYRLCDYDGDGIYEFNGFIYPALAVHDWVKTMPGDPSAVNSDANL